MDLAFSNIAWSKENEHEVFRLLHKYSVRGIEVAPSMVWPDWVGLSEDAACHYKEKLLSEGFVIPSLQAVLYAKQDCMLFGEEKHKKNFIEHLIFVAHIAEAMGAKIVVFGAPKNRQRHVLSMQKAQEVAAEVFNQLNQVYAACNVYLCLEPNPVQYECDFITDAQQGNQFIQTLDLSHVRLHLDSAALFLAQDDVKKILPLASHNLQHFHVSEPYLGSFEAPLVPHELIARTLNDIFYDNWLSIEMRKNEHHELLSIDLALRYVCSTYQAFYK